MKRHRSMLSISPLSALRPLAAMSLALSLLGGCGSSSTRVADASDSAIRGQEYVIGPSDELDVRVWRNPELSTQIIVRPDGRITMPLIGAIEVAGRTPSEVQRLIHDELLAFIKKEDAVVTVAVTAVNSYNITVAGNVATPGRYASSSYLTVSDAIALAGGPTRFAEPESTVVIRHGQDGTVDRISVDYEEIIEGDDPNQNIVLLRDDVVHVP